MRIVYGVVGEGMGHAVRSRVVLDYLLEQGHDLLIVVSGRAHGFLARHFEGRKKVRVELIHGLHLTFEGSVLAVGESVADNLEELPANLATNFDTYRRVIGSQFKPEVAFSDVPDILVNIQSSDGTPAYLKLSLSLEMDNELQKTGMTALMPRLVDQFQSYLRELRVDDLKGSEGVLRLKEELLRRVNASAAPYKVRDVLLKQMIIQ